MIIPRNLEYKINHFLTVFPIVALIGARQTGKTVLAKKVRSDWRYLDLENPDAFDLISRDPYLYFEQYPEHIIFDEAQLYPELFKILRGVVDNARSVKGRFILTGSSSPELLTQISESLAGRIGIIEIGTLKANEYFQIPLSPFYSLFESPFEKRHVNLVHQPLSNAQMRKIWLKGGYPEPLLTMDAVDHQLWMEQYRNTYINRDIAQLFPRLNKVKYQRFIHVLAKLSGTIINKSELGRALEFDESTARDYLSIAHHTFIWREVLSYEKSQVKSVIKMPKGYLRDTGLLHFLLRIHTEDDLITSPYMGNSFEAFVIDELLKGLNATLLTDCQGSYYRTRAGVEVDLILEGSFGLMPIEIKYGSKTPLKQLGALTKFIEENHLPFGLLINQGHEAMWVTDKIYQVPLGWL